MVVSATPVLDVLRVGAGHCGPAGLGIHRSASPAMGDICSDGSNGSDARGWAQHSGPTGGRAPVRRVASERVARCRYAGLSAGGLPQVRLEKCFHVQGRLRARESAQISALIMKLEHSTPYANARIEY